MMTKLSKKIQPCNNESHIKAQGEIVAANFSKKVSTYEEYALAQKFAAQSLHNKIVSQAIKLNPLSILEIGCGTGLLSRHLATEFPYSKIDFLDPSSEMLKQCKHNLDQHLRLENSFQNYQYLAKSIEDYLDEQIQYINKYNLIVSSFAFHWLADLPSVMNKLINSLELGGQIFFAYPTDKSFSEWKTVCNMLNLPFTGNKFPSTNDLQSMIKSKRVNLIWNEYFFKFNLPSSLYFFREIKNLGAETSIKSDETNSSNRQLSVSEFRHLIRTWDKKFSKNIDQNEIGVESNSLVDCTYWLVEGIITRHS